MIGTTKTIRWEIWFISPNARLLIGTLGTQPSAEQWMRRLSQTRPGRWVIAPLVGEQSGAPLGLFHN